MILQECIYLDVCSRRRPFVGRFEEDGCSWPQVQNTRSPPIRRHTALTLLLLASGVRPLALVIAPPHLHRILLLPSPIAVRRPWLFDVAAHRLEHWIRIACWKTLETQTERASGRQLCAQGHRTARCSHPAVYTLGYFGGHDPIIALARNTACPCLRR